MVTNSMENLSYRITQQRGLIFGVMIITALLSFELFNYSTTEYALSDLLGGLEFLGIRWATILAIAFCGIDFAGIARLFTPEKGENEPAEVWYLFGAWLLAATMNAMLTWWGVSLAVLNHETLGNAIIDRNTMIRLVPIFVAVMVWLIRVLMIGTFTVAGDRLFTLEERPQALRKAPKRRLVQQPMSVPAEPALHRPSAATAAFSPAPKPQSTAQREPVFRSASYSQQSPVEGNESRQDRMF